MASRSAKYELVFIMPDATTVTRVREGADVATSSMFGYPPKRAVYATRYFPSRKTWRVFDLREVSYMSMGAYQRRVIPKPSIELPDKDAAVMWALMNL